MLHPACLVWGVKEVGQSGGVSSLMETGSPAACGHVTTVVVQAGETQQLLPTETDHV